MPSTLLMYLGTIQKPATGHTFRRWRFTRDAPALAGARKGDYVERCATCADRGERAPFVLRPRLGRPLALRGASVPAARVETVQ